MQNVEGYAGLAGREPHAWETGLMDTITYVGLDVHKATVCVALAETGRGCEVRRVGVFENRPEILIKLAARLSKGGRRLSFCYEDGVIPARVPVSLNLTDPAARRCTVASTGGPAMYFIGIDVSTKESALCILDGKGKIARETKLPPIPRSSHDLSPPRGLPLSGSAWNRVVLPHGCFPGCSAMASQ